MNPRGRTSLFHGWVVLCVLFVFGGLQLASVLLQLWPGAPSGVPMFVALGAGSAIGAWAAARHSPHGRYNEPITAAVAVVMVSMYWYVEGLAMDLAWWRIGLYGLTVVGGTLAGTWLGHRTSKAGPPSAVAIAIAGMLLAMGAVLALSLFAVGTLGSPGDGAAMLVTLLAQVIGCMAAQCFTEEPVGWRASWGATLAWPLMVFIYMIGSGESGSEDLIGTLLGFVVVSLVLLPIGRGGSSLAWALRRRRRTRLARALPPAELV